MRNGPRVMRNGPRGRLYLLVVGPAMKAWLTYNEVSRQLSCCSRRVACRNPQRTLASYSQDGD